MIKKVQQRTGRAADGKRRTIVLDAKGETAAWVAQDQDGRWYVADETHRPR